MDRKKLFSQLLNSHFEIFEEFFDIPLKKRSMKRLKNHDKRIEEPKNKYFPIVIEKNQAR